MTKRRRLEAAEAIAGKPDLNPPVLMTDEELLYWYGLLERALDAKANAPLQTAPALGDERQSEGRRAFDSMIYRIADRIKDAPRAPVPPMVVAYGANPGSAAEAHTSEADELSASELLKVLRWKLGMKS